MRKALFLDRDGIINVDYGYVCKKEDFFFTDGIFEFLQTIKDPIFVITNQSGIGRGYYSQQDFEKLTAYMCQEFAKRSITITETFYCPHRPDEGCLCRKPEPKMILDAAKKYEIDLARSTFIGDKCSDMQAATAAGVGNKIAVGISCKEADRSIQSLKGLKIV